MNLTRLPDIRRQLLGMWDSGTILSSVVSGDPVFPCRLRARVPSSKDFTDSFEEVRKWISEIKTVGGIRLEWRTVNNRLRGNNPSPSGLWVDSIDDALALIGRKTELRKFVRILDDTRAALPELEEWMRRSPMKALAYADEWNRLLAIVRWMKANPRPGIYIREADIPGVHTKIIENNSAILTELLDAVLPPDRIDFTATGKSGFCRRYGFREKPKRYVRFRVLDPNIRVLPVASAETDIELTSDVFAQLDIPCAYVFIVENEITFLAFPALPDSIVLYGGGNSAADAFRGVAWLGRRLLFYWGDLDIDGFRILRDLRRVFPAVRSILMDDETLNRHRDLWTTESGGGMVPAEMNGLTDEEQSVCRLLQSPGNGMCGRIRFEQERIGFEHVKTQLGKIAEGQYPGEIPEVAAILQRIPENR